MSIVRKRLECPKFDRILSKEKPKSGIWKHFGYPADANGKIVMGDVAICLICKIAVSSKSKATSNLWGHLKVHHPQQYSKLNPDFKKKQVNKEKDKESSPQTTAPKPLIPQTKTQETHQGDSSRSEPETPKIKFENEEVELGGRRIVNISYFFEQLMQLNKHGPSNCSLNNMTIISEIRRGLASEIKFKCSKCNFEKLVWTDEVSCQLPINLNSAAVTGSIGIRNGLSALEDFLDVLNISSVSINTTYAARKAPKVAQTERELGAKQDDATEGFTVVVNGSWEKRTPATSQSKTTLEKQPLASEETSSVREPEPKRKKLGKKPEDVSGPKSVTEPNHKKRSEKRSDVLAPQPILLMQIQPNSERSVTASVMDVDPETGTQTSNEKILPDISEAGPSSQMEPDSSMMEQDSMTCDNYPSDKPQPDSQSKIKIEKIDDNNQKDSSSTTIPMSAKNLSEQIAIVARAQELRQVSNSLTNLKADSLFHPPVLIKEEPISFEEES